ncbi:hypothetical protein EYV94_17290 [Puteibacter caeruleilacunae]|nr:hypothetical protein EYV94_17290 [Puteibacter caeruleilacunae]
MKIILLTLTALFLSTTLIAQTWNAPSVEGWERGDTKSFDSENLYEHINGAAGFYIDYGFQNLWVTYYKHDTQEMTVEIYKHQSPAFSFGIFRQERPDQPKWIPLGTQAYEDLNLINFHKGPFYVKIYGHGMKTQSTVKMFAERVCKALEVKSEMPDLVKIFPVEWKIKDSEQYIPKDFLGYSFFKNTFVTDYNNNEKDFKVFIVTTDTSEDAKQVLRTYLKTIGKEENDIDEKAYTIDDPFNGSLVIYPSKNYLLGTLNCTNNKLRKDIFKSLRKRIK